MPTLIRNYQKQVLVTQLKKAVAAIENDFALMKVEEDVENLLDTSVFRKYNNYIMQSSYYAEGEFHDIMRKYLHMKKTDNPGSNDNGTFLTGNYHETQILGSTRANSNCRDYTTYGYSMNYIFHINARGMGISQDTYIAQQQEFGLGPRYSAILGAVNIDVNGTKKGPNQLGRDMFVFYVDSSGKLIPFGSYKAGVMVFGSKDVNWKVDKTMCGEVGVPITGVVTGVGCAARIIESGWVMDY